MHMYICEYICIQVCVYVYTHTHTYIPYFLYLFSIDDHLGYFHVLAIVNCATVNFGVHVSFWISVFVFSGIYPVVEVLSHMVVLFSVFWWISILFSTVAVPIYIPTNSVWGFPFLHILANSCYYYYYYFYDSHSGMCKVISDCTFTLCFSDD